MPEETTKTIHVIHCWSAPRSRSTALLYSFESRDNCVALDEPLYREWLLSTALKRSYRSYFEQPGTYPENCADPSVWDREQQSLEERILHAAASLPNNGVIFLKQMSKFESVYDFDHQVCSDEMELIHQHVFLIRDPVAVLGSWSAHGNVHDNNPTP